MNEQAIAMDYSKHSLSHLKTDPGAKIELSTCPDVHITTTTPWTVSFADLISQFSRRPATTGKKSGTRLIIGPCLGTRRDANLPYASIAVLDADSTLLPDGNLEEGAPAPEHVHAQLKAWGISHLLYTTRSHGQKGNRYRVLFPVQLRNRQELAGFLTYISSSIQTAGLALALTPESLKWSQPWAVPQVSDNLAPYWCAYHVGTVPEPGYLAYCYGFVDAQGVPIRQKAAQMATDTWSASSENKNSLRWHWNTRYPLEEVLEMFEYRLVGQQAALDEQGEPYVVSRWIPPGSTSNSAGVVVFKRQDKSPVVYSHHTNDRLANDRANDSYAAFQLLAGMQQNQLIETMIGMVEQRLADEFNREHPAILAGMAKYKIGNKGTDDFGGVVYGMMESSSFILQQACEPKVPCIDRSDPGDDNGNSPSERKIKFLNPAEWWLRHTDLKIVHKATIYEPCPILSEVSQPVYRRDADGSKSHPYFNLFLSWGIKPKPGKWSLLEWHFRNAICGGIEAEYEYLLNWFAHLVQFPTVKPGVALVIRGGKGWGKSKVFHRFANAFGSNAIVLGNNKQLTGQFNAHLRSRLLGIVEESFFAAAHQQEGVLKHLITDEVTTFEAKGVDPISGRSLIRVVLITNMELAAPASRDERRYFVPTTTDASLARDKVGGGRGGFFPQLFSEMDNGGIEAFLWDMAHREISASAPFDVPETAGLETQRALMLDGIESFFFEALSAGGFTLPSGVELAWTEAGVTIREADLITLAKNYLDPYSKNRNAAFRIDNAIRELFAGAAVRDGTMRRFPGLQACRARFVEATKISSTTFFRSA